ncbi:MAG: YbaB/EbfC family nucleoid-associated protein [Chloroflexota bacterium]
MKDLFRQAQQLQARLAQVQQELENKTVEVEVGGGVVKIVINGQQKVQQLKLSPQAVDPADIELLEDLLVAAMNEAVARSQEMAQKDLAAVTGGLKLPGLP